MEIAKAYGSMPYPSKFFLQTNPEQLATLGRFFGLKTKKPEKCRVLELGCGNGSNLLSHAYNLPDSEFVGIDIAPNHIASANDFAKDLGLNNIEFIEADLMTTDSSLLGKFDYITAHGLISWIPDPVFDRVFSIYRELLETNGVGYISYNAYPGCHYREMVRNIMRFSTREVHDPIKKVQKAISSLAFLSENAVDSNVYKPIVQGELERHFKHEPSDIFHDDLGEFYKPLYFHEFAAKLDENQLQYLSEAELQAMSIHDLSTAAQEFLKNTEGVVEREQYMDFLRGRLFRQTLICHDSAELNREPDPEKMDEFLLSAPIRVESGSPKITEQVPVKFVGNKGFGLEIDHPLTKACLVRLGEIWGGASAVPQLLQYARQMLEDEGFSSDDWDQEFTVAKTILFRIVQGTDLVQLHTFVPNANQAAGEKPKINDLARWQLGISNNVTTLFGLNVGIDDPISKQLLLLMNGERTVGQLVNEIRSFVEKSEGIDNKQEFLEGLDQWITGNIGQLGRLGLFVS